MGGLTKYIYDPEKFKTYNECIICTVEFNSEAQITPLPCNIKHYFHTECITEWLKNKPECPLCRYKITVEELERFKERVEQMIENEEA